MSPTRLLLRRAAAQRTLLAAVVTVLLPALVLVTLIGLHASAVRAAAVRSALKAMAPDERTVRVVYGSGTEWEATPEQRTAFFAQVRQQVDTAFADVGARVSTTVVSGPYVLDAAAAAAAAGAGAGPAASASGGTDAVAFWSGDTLRAEAHLVAGQWPEPAPGDGDFPALVSQQSLDAHHWQLGDLVATRSGWESGRVLRFRIAGVYEPAEPADRFWRHNGDQAPVLVDASVTARPQTVLSQAAVTAEPDPTGFPADRIPLFAQRLAAFDAWVPGSSSSDDFAASLDDRLAPRIRDLVGVTTVSVRLEWLVAAELGVLTAAALALIARSLADRRHAGDGLLRARGSAVSALARVHVVEGLLLALPCAALAPWVAGWMEHRIGAAWAHGDPGAAGLAADADRLRPAQWLVAGIGGILAAALLSWVGTRSALSYSAVARVRRRSAIRSILQRTTVDVVILAFALAAFWELLQAGGDAARTGALPWPQVLAPAVLLTAGALIVLRILPFLAAPVGRLAAHGRGAVAALVGWRLGRAVRSQALPMALLVVAVAIGVQAGVLLSSAQRSASDQAGYAVGADVKASELTFASPQTIHALATVPGTGTGFAALRTSYRLTRPGQAVATHGGVDTTTPTVTVLGLNPAASRNVVVLRPDQAGGKDWSQLSTLLAGDGWDANGGVGAVVPGAPSRLTADVTYRWDGAGTATACALGGLRVLAQFTDAYGFPGSIDLGTVDHPDGVPHTLTGRLDPATIAYPIRITSIATSFPAPLCPSGVAAPPADGVTIDVAAPAFDGKPLSFPRGLTYGIPYQASQADPLTGKASKDSRSPDGDPQITVSADGSAAFGYREHIGFTSAKWTAQPIGQSDLDRNPSQLHRVFEIGPPATRAPLTVPVIATDHLLAALGKHVGDTLSTSAFKQPVVLRFVASVKGLPGGATDAPDALVVPLGLLAHELQRPSSNVDGGGQLTPMTGEWWASTSGASGAPAVAERCRTVLAAAHLPRPAVVADRETETAARRDYPFAAGFSLTLKLGTAAALAFVLLGLALHTVSAMRERAGELAILDALGLTRRRAALLLLAEQAGIALFGALAGLGLADLALRSEFKLMVFTPSGAAPTPPAVEVFDWPTLGLAAVAAAVFGAVAMLIAFSLSERASFRAEAD